MSHQLARAVIIALVSLPGAGMAQDRATVQGEWLLNRELTPAPPQRNGDSKPPEGRRPPAGRGGAPGGGGPPGGFGGFGGGGRGPSEKEIRKLEVVRRRIEEVPQKLVISIDGTQVQIVDEFGRTTNLVADGKKQERVTGDGEFKSTTTLGGGRLVVEEDFGGPKLTTTFERITTDGQGDLRVTLQIEGMPEMRGRDGDRDGARGPRPPITRVYDAAKPLQ